MSDEFEEGTVTGRFARDILLRQAIIASGNDLEKIKAALPPDFGTDADEVAAMLATIEHPPGAVVEQSSGDDTRVEHPADAEPLPSPDMSLDEARAVLNDWQVKLHAAKQDADTKRREQQMARQKLVESVNFFLGNPTLTRDQLVREHLASEATRKASGAARHRPLTTHGPSAVDIGRAGHGGNVNRRYYPTRRGLVPGQKAYSLADSVARSGSGIIDTHGTAQVPAVKTE